MLSLRTENRIAFEALLKNTTAKSVVPPKAYLAGIGGIGVSAVAHLLMDKGWSVSGADVRESQETRALSKRGAKIYLGHSAANLKDDPVDVLVYSSAVSKKKPDIVEAKKQGALLLKRAEALASFMNLYRGICVAGMHGKTTVTGLLVLAMCNLNLEPGYAVGGLCRRFEPHARLGKSQSSWFVAETDESDGSILEFEPEYALILNLDRDHLEYYGNEEGIENTFAQFSRQVQKKIICCADNEWVTRLSKEHFRERSISFGFSPQSDYQAVLRENSSKGEQVFCVRRRGVDWGEFKICLMGTHNVSNATAVIALLAELGYSPREIAGSIGDFNGTNRRQEILFKNQDYRIIDDYGHHPAEIEATIRAVKAQGGRLLVVFQPHRFTRTQLLLEEFSTCFKEADRLFLTDVYAASEEPIPGVTGRSMADAVRAHGQEVEYLEHLEDVGGVVAKNSRPGDIILFLGAGDITLEAHKYAALLDGAKSQS